MRKARGRARRPAESAVFDPEHPPAIPGLTGLTRIGGGASATVYRGEEPAMRRKVAVKLLHTPVRDPRGRRAFERECALAGQVGQHPCVANLFTSGFAGDRPFIVMQYYARGSLASRLRTGQQFTVAEVLGTGVRICGALQFAHDQGILHRDVKPQNILCDAFGDPVLADFGIATDRDAASMILRHAMTPAFAAPEVLRDGGGWPVSDVWSLAATLYALLAGHPPFYDPQRVEPHANLRAITGPLPLIRRSDVPGHLQETLRRALIGEPDSRTTSARRLAEEVNADERQLGLAPTPIRVGPDGHAGPTATRAANPKVPPVASDVETNGTSREPLACDTAGGDGPEPFFGSMDAGPIGSSGADPAPEYGSAQNWTTGSRSGPRFASTETGFLSASEAYRTPETAAGRPKRRPVPKVFITTGGVSILIAVGVAYVLTGQGRGAATSAQGTAPADTVNPSDRTLGTSASAAPGSALPPADVNAVALAGSSARITWKDTEPGYKTVVISLGSGHRPQVVANQSPQVITGLDPTKPYCFAVGYVYSMQGGTSYSVPACIRGGVASTGDG